MPHPFLTVWWPQESKIRMVGSARAKDPLKCIRMWLGLYWVVQNARLGVPDFADKDAEWCVSGGNAPWPILPILKLSSRGRWDYYLLAGTQSFKLESFEDEDGTKRRTRVPVDPRTLPMSVGGQAKRARSQLNDVGGNDVEKPLHCRRQEGLQRVFNYGCGLHGDTNA